MSNKETATSGNGYERLKGDKADLLGNLIFNRHTANFLRFEEHDNSRVLSSFDVSLDADGEYCIVFPYNGVNYLIPYGVFDHRAENLMQKNMVDEKFHEADLRVTGSTAEMPPDLKNYVGMDVRTANGIYLLTPSTKGLPRIVMQTTFMELGSNKPIGEAWTGLIIPAPQPAQKVLYQNGLANPKAIETVLWKSNQGFKWN